MSSLLSLLSFSVNDGSTAVQILLIVPSSSSNFAIFMLNYFCISHSILHRQWLNSIAPRNYMDTVIGDTTFLIWSCLFEFASLTVTCYGVVDLGYMTILDQSVMPWKINAPVVDSGLSWFLCWFFICGICRCEGLIQLYGLAFRKRTMILSFTNNTFYVRRLLFNCPDFG